MTERQRYDIYLQHPATGLIHAAEAVVDEPRGVLRQVDFRYRAKYLAHPGAIALDPVQLPLRSGVLQLHCRGGSPAFIDDYLPDAWGRRVMARLARYREHRDYDANSVIDSLALAGGSRIGALSIVPRGEQPQFDPGHPLAALADAERIAQDIDNVDFAHANLDQAGLLYLAHSGTGVGGARPKALVEAEGKYYLAKFNRRRGDAYNNARVELACLRMAAAAGLAVGKGRVADGINGRDVLLLERFDMAPGGGRYHLITANGLLKQPQSQQDPGRAFHYGMLADLVRQHVADVETGLCQLLAVMFFNRAIHNTDDHERNTSFINRGKGFELAPAYDMVPSLVMGEYHAAGYAYRPDPPRPSEARDLGKVFGLPRPRVRAVAERVIEALADWPSHAETAEVSEQDMARVAEVLRP